MNASKLVFLIISDMRRNPGIHLDALRANALLLEVRIEQYIYAKTHTDERRIPAPIWRAVRFLGLIYQLFLFNSNIPGSVSIGRGFRLPHPQNIVLPPQRLSGNSRRSITT